MEIFSGTIQILKSKKDYNIILNRIIFIFEDISWSNLVLCFRFGLNVRLNGGTVTKRFALNTVEFTLAQILYGMGYTKKDIFSSYKYLKENELKLNANRIIVKSEQASVFYECVLRLYGKYY